MIFADEEYSRTKYIALYYRARKCFLVESRHGRVYVKPSPTPSRPTTTAVVVLTLTHNSMQSVVGRRTGSNNSGVSGKNTSSKNRGKNKKQAYALHHCGHQGSKKETINSRQKPVPPAKASREGSKTNLRRFLGSSEENMN